jgi:hypothetical protein
MIDKVESIDSQCPCGQPLTALLFYRSRYKLDARGQKLKWNVRHWIVLKLYYRIPGILEKKRITRCPTCDRDFSQLTADQVKEGIWTS